MPKAGILSCILAAFALHATPAMAQQASCGTVPYSVPTANALTAPVAPGLTAINTPLGSPTGVLSQAYNDAVSVDATLLRLRIEQCRSVARTMPAVSPGNPNDPSAYKPRTQWDNAPWRFNMDKCMTAAEFEAWLKAKGIHVSKGVPKTGTETPANPPTDQLPAGQVPVKP